MDKHKERQMLPLLLSFYPEETHLHTIQETQILQKQWKEKSVCHFVLKVLILSLIVKHSD